MKNSGVDIFKFVIGQLLLLIKKSLFVGAWLIPAVVILMILMTWTKGDFAFLSNLGFYIKDSSYDQADLLCGLMYLSMFGALCVDIVKWFLKKFFNKEIKLKEVPSITIVFIVLTFVYIVLISSIFVSQGFDFGMLIFILVLSFINYVYLFLYWIVDSLEKALGKIKFI